MLKFSVAGILLFNTFVHFVCHASQASQSNAPQFLKPVSTPSASSSSIPGASSTPHATATPQQTEEGWRWRNNLLLRLNETNIDLRAEHQRLADLIQQVHIRLTGDWPNKNLLAFSFTLITQTAGRGIEIHPIITRYSKGMGALRPILFQSGQV